MARGADLFVVCKNCGSGVSPYVTECPYCGQRVRKRAPKIERPRETGGRHERERRRRGSGLGGLRTRSMAAVGVETRPWATISLIALCFGAYLCAVAGAFDPIDAIVLGKLDGDWWRILTAPFVHLGGGGAVFAGGAYQFATAVGIGVFGWLLERRHGAWAVAVVALLAGAGGMLVAAALETVPVAAGANGLALGLLAAWAVPDLLTWRRDGEWEGDLLGTAVIAAVLLLMPVAVTFADPVAGVTGGVVGLLVGYPLAKLPARD